MEPLYVICRQLQIPLEKHFEVLIVHELETSYVFKALGTTFSVIILLGRFCIPLCCKFSLLSLFVL